MTTQTQTATPATDTPTRRYLWLMTVRTDDQEASFKNTCDIPAGMTRNEAYNSIREFVAKQFGTNDFATVFFSLEPNQL